MIVDMKKMVLVAHGSRRNKILRALHRSKLVEVANTREIENTIQGDSSQKFEELNEKSQKIQSILQFLKDEKAKAKLIMAETKKTGIKFEYEPIKKKPFQSIMTVSYDEFSEISTQEIELLAELSELEEIQSRYTEINAEILKINNFVEQLEIYRKIDSKFSIFKDTKFASVVLGCVPLVKKPELDAIIAESNMAEFEIYGGNQFVSFAFICLKENFDSIMAKLQTIEFARSTFDFDMNAEELIEQEKAKLQILKDEKLNLLKKSLEKEFLIDDWKKLYDFYFVEIAKCGATSNTRCTQTVFVLEAWFPASEQKRIDAILKSCGNEIVFEFRDPEESEEVPTLVKSGKLVEPYQDVTNMYSVPNYRGDFDPNPIMAFFYFLFFGMMLQDAAYGLLLAIGGFVMYKVTKPVPGKGRLLLIIAMGGISTVVWGAVFGGWFGLETIGFLENLVWFKPLDKPILMLALSLGLGFFQIVVGMGCNAYNLIRKGRGWEAFFNVGSWYLAFIGIILIALNMFLKINSDIMKFFGIAFLVLGLLILVLGGAYGKKGVGKKVVGAIGGVAKLYDGVNIMSDILSYSRLFGLGLSGGVVAMVINKICGVLMQLLTINGSPALGIILSIPIFAFGHLFNIFISTLGAYVHNARLQYIEFYGKFYEGAGKSFVPLGSQTKYTFIDNGESKEKKTKQAKLAM